MTEKLLLNQKGQALAMALVVVTITTMSVFFMLTRIYNTEQALRAPRIKAQQTIQKVRIDNALKLPLLYDCTKIVSDKQSCSISVTKLQSILSPVKGADCGDTAYVPATNEIVPPANGCGFSLRPLVPGGDLLDYSARVFSANIHYMGTEVAIKDTPISFNIPGQLLIGDITVCPAATPKFKGFDDKGDALCEAFASPMSCGPGEFVKTVDPTTFVVTCHNYVSGKSCGSNEFLGSLRYSNGVYTGSCSTRLNPFIYYDFNPELTLSQQSFVGLATSGADYKFYDVGFTLAQPSSKACDASTGTW